MGRTWLPLMQQEMSFLFTWVDDVTVVYLKICMNILKICINILKICINILKICMLVDFLIFLREFYWPIDS